MATLVLSTVGTAFGGPVGGALGSMVGQAVDQSLLGPSIRKGPRLGDLSVQTSSYGSPIPRIYGTMRVAGTVIWSTDIQEDESIEGGGKGSSEYVAYRYSASFAVALSSRPIRDIRRIWADGKLIRGAAGDFKVKTKFRVATGDEDQQQDPLIASIEGIDHTPAYRGLALAVFEDLDLGEFGGRIPVLTFEVVAEESISIDDMLRDASAGLIDAREGMHLPGFAAHGTSVGDSLAGIIDLTGVTLSERDAKLRPPEGGVRIIDRSELGCTIERGAVPAVQRRRASLADRPISLLLSYHDRDRDYQAGQMRASSGGGQGRKEERIELPAVVASDQAKAMAEEALARKLRLGDRLKLRLAPTCVTLRPGDLVSLPDSALTWMLRTVSVVALSVEAEAVAFTGALPPLPADPGRAVEQPDLPIGRTELAVFEAPPPGDAPDLEPQVYLAAASPTAWKAVPVELSLGDEPQPAAILTRPSVIGKATSLLPPGTPFLIDESSGFTVQLADASQQLLNADDDALMGGANLAILGSELLQFGRAEEIGAGLFRVSRLLRGRRGSEWAMDDHAIGEAFCLVGSSVKAIRLPVGALGRDLVCIAHGVGDVPPLPTASWAVSGESLRPPSPCHLTLIRTDGAVRAEWVRRSHRAWEWLDAVDVPADGFAERYRVTVAGPGGSLASETEMPCMELQPEEIPASPGETVQISVATVGPRALSHPICQSFVL